MSIGRAGGQENESAETEKKGGDESISAARQGDELWCDVRSAGDCLSHFDVLKSTKRFSRHSQAQKQLQLRPQVTKPAFESARLLSSCMTSLCTVSQRRRSERKAGGLP